MMYGANCGLKALPTITFTKKAEPLFVFFLNLRELEKIAYYIHKEGYS